jgi:Spy/CpxP family protein refolding chaperone
MKKALFFAAVLAIAFIPFALAEHGEGPGPGGPGGHDGQEMGAPDMMMEKGFNRALEDLKLTDEQEQKLREIKDSSKRDIFNLKHEIQLAIMDIQDEYKKETSDATRINACIDKLSDAQKKLMKIRSGQMLRMKAVLTPEQFKKLLQKMDKAKDKVKKGFFEKLTGKK